MSSASQVTTIWRFTNECIIIIIVFITACTRRYEIYVQSYYRDIDGQQSNKVKARTDEDGKC